MKRLFLLILVALTLSTFSSTAQNRPTGLMIDLVTDADALYQKGYRAEVKMQDLSNEEFSRYQYAAIRSSRPTLGWIVPQGKGNTKQESYQIVIDESYEDARQHKGKVWNSREVKSCQSSAVAYRGNDLQPDKTYYWSVRITTNHGKSRWSDIQAFRTASSLKPYAVSYKPLIREKDYPQTIKRIAPRTTFIDFGKASFASLELTLQCDKDADTIYVAIGEDAKDGQINAKPHGTVRYYRYPLILKRGKHTYPIIPADDKRNTGAQAVLVPEYLDQVAPMRYCQIENYEPAIAQNDIVRHTTIYPFNLDAAHFLSDNETLNAVWELCKYTIKATSAFGIYVDGDRERIPYEADALINQLCHYTTDREYAMARRTSEYLLQHPTWPTEWILQALIIAWNDYMYTGDLRSIEANYETLKARTLRSLRRENYLISTTDSKVQSAEFRQSIKFNGNIRDIVDWPRCGDWPHGEDDHYHLTPYNTVVNAFHYQALVLLEQMAQLTGRKQEAEQLHKESAALRKAFNTLLFDNEKGVYRDGVESDHVSLHSNLFPLALGVTYEQDHERIMEYIRSRGLVCSVYAAQFLMDAIYESRDADYGLQLLTKEDDRSWYNMVRHGATMTYEAWDDKFKNNQDWNHAWGAAPANIIPRRLVGVMPLKAGFEYFSIHPQTSTLSHIEATVPTIKGEINIEINNSSKSYILKASIPANTTAEVVLPLMGKAKELLIDGRKAEIKHSLKNGIDCGTITSGEHTFEVLYE